MNAAICLTTLLAVVCLSGAVGIKNIGLLTIAFTCLVSFGIIFTIPGFMFINIWILATPEYKAKVITSVTACAKEYNTNLKDVIEIMKQNKIPETKEQKCVVGCFYEKMGYVTDHKVDWEKVKALNPQKYDTPELVEKVNQVTDACSKVVTEKFTDICELGVPAIKCLKEEAEKVQLPKPDVKFDSA